jgi:hypothetical protein
VSVRSHTLFCSYRRHHVLAIAAMAEDSREIMLQLKARIRPSSMRRRGAIQYYSSMCAQIITATPLRLVFGVIKARMRNSSSYLCGVSASEVEPQIWKMKGCRAAVAKCSFHRILYLNKRASSNKWFRAINLCREHLLRLRLGHPLSTLLCLLPSLACDYEP